jgi:hypothetical protein
MSSKNKKKDIIAIDYLKEKVYPELHQALMKVCNFFI